MGVNYTNVAKKIKEYNFSASQIAQKKKKKKMSLKRTNFSFFRSHSDKDKCDCCPFHTELKAGRDCSCTVIVKQLFGSDQNSCEERLGFLMDTLDKKRTIINGRFAKI